MIEAAGGVVWRPGKGHIEILVVHRPHHDDWSLPKGKLEGHERALDAALREVHEETGLRCRAQSKLPEVRYRDAKGRPKRVRYWAMEPVSGSFVPNHEVDRVAWVALDDVASTLSYPHDVGVVVALRKVLKPVG